MRGGTGADPEQNGSTEHQWVRAPLSLRVARARLRTRASLGSKVDDRWLIAQSAKSADEFHPLYGLLESSSTEPGIESFLDGLERSLSAEIGGQVASRARRLTSGSRTDYWSAIDELSFAARLTSCGLSATLGTPDVVVKDAADTLTIELTAPERTRELEVLQELLAHEWRGPGGMTLHLGRQTWKPIARDRTAIAAEVRVAALAGPIEITDVPLHHIVAPDVLRIEIDPTAGLGVDSQTAAAFGAYDPVPDIESAIDSKRKQLRSLGEVVVAVDLWALDLNPLTFAIRSAMGLGAGDPLPKLDTYPNVVGVIAFFRGAPGAPPMSAFWLANAAWTGHEPPLLPAVLDCLGVLR